MTAPDYVFVALGSNLGNRHNFLELGRRRLADLPRTRLVAESSIEETDPIGPSPQGLFLNQMVLLHTELSPRELLHQCQIIEREAGRVRQLRWGPRTLDLDIVRHGNRVVNQDDLLIPHPEIPNRNFWQRELEELEIHVGKRPASETTQTQADE